MSVIADLILTGGRWFPPTPLIEASVAIKDGKILSVGAPDAMPPARETVDVSGMHVLPGGSTCMCISAIRLSAEGGLRERHSGRGVRRRHDGVRHADTIRRSAPRRRSPPSTRWRPRSPLDYGLYAVLGEDTIANVPALIETGVIGFKLYMGNTFGKIASPSTGAMLEAFEVVAATGKRISLHAETNSIMERRETRLRAAGRTDPLAHLPHAPP